MEYCNGIHICGNFNPVTKRKPRNWVSTGYKILVPYKFKWREKIGNVECDCKECEEHYQPFYGWSWVHLKDCALMKFIERRPQILNLSQYSCRDMFLIASSE